MVPQQTAASRCKSAAGFRQWPCSRLLATAPLMTASFAYLRRSLYGIACFMVLSS
ncbi:DUF4398 domain-containing protein, partial [Xanthomonas perforans]|nr:DUF4398 domain-containing protein [Xanthomonas perforans]